MIRSLFFDISSIFTSIPYCHGISCSLSSLTFSLLFLGITFGIFISTRVRQLATGAGSIL